MSVPGSEPFVTPAQGIPLAQMGAKAQQQYHGDGIAITPTAEGAHLRAIMQDLEAEAASDGLWLTSTADEDAGKPNRLRVKAVSVQREGRAAAPSAAASAPAALQPPSAALAGANAVPIHLPSTGVVRASKDAAVWLRPGIIEEYTVSTDGVRQDFVVLERPRGDGGALAVDLEVTGARADAAAYGTKLTVSATGRELAYSRLKVTDATGKELTARMEVSVADRLRVVVDDASAVYPVRIDPTFSDADWVSMNSGLAGTNGDVRAIIADGVGNVYIGGEFTMVGTVSANYIAKWNGSVWSAMGSGMDLNVYALALSGGNLYAGGAFSSAGGQFAPRIAKWDGSSWSALGGSGVGMNFAVSALAVSGSDLYAGGSFTTVGALNANRIAKWNGTAWSALGSGINNQISALAVSGGSLYAAGFFSTAGGVTVNNIAKWDGSSWSGLGNGVNNGVHALAVSGGDLYVGGQFTSAGGGAANRIAKWNGSAWSAVGTGMDNSVNALVVSGSDLYAGGSFSTAGGASSSRVAKWNGALWSAIGSGVNSSIFALAANGTDLYAGGVFTSAGGARADRLARWSGSSWSAFGTPSAMNNEVLALAVGNGDLYAAGIFTFVGALPVNYIAKWNGSSWSTLGSGMDGTVVALAVGGDGLYAGGDFTTAGGVSANRIAKWNGTAWLALGSGMNSTVRVLAARGGEVYASGYFSTAGGVSAQRIAKWDGSVWSPLGSGVDAEVETLLVLGGDLYVGGSFTTIGGVPANRIAKWNGSAWSALGSGMANGGIYALAAAGNVLYAGGTFSYEPFYSIAKWDGTAWSPVGSGMNLHVFALAVSGSDVYAAGQFTVAGGIPANRIAKWNGSAWSALGSGLNSGSSGTFVRTLAFYNGDLYAGGRFSTAGDKISPFLARASLRLPILTLGSASAITSNSAIFNGTINPNGSTTTAQFEYGLTTNYGTTANITLSPNDGTTGQNVGSGLTGLAPLTVYHYRLVATSGNGTSVSEDRTFTTLGVPEIAVEQPAGSNLTDGTASIPFGAVAVGASSSSFTFIIRNSGAADLTGLAVTKDGSHAGDFSVSVIGMSDTVAPGGSTSFTVTFTPTAGGTRSAAIHIASNDADENPFDITLTGTATAPEIVVELSGNNISDGDALGFQAMNGSNSGYSLTIKNTGLADLTGLTVTIDGPDAAMFSSLPSPTAPVAPNGSTPLHIGFAPTSLGPKAAVLHIESNDADENPFDIVLSGDGIASNNAFLSNLTTSFGSFTPSFNGNTLNYTANVAHPVSAITLTPLTSNSYSTVTVNSAPVVSGSASAPVLLNVGNNTINVICTAQDGITTKTYTLNVTRGVPAPGDFDPSFNPGANGWVHTVVPQPDGKILVGGNFNNIAGTARSYLARLNGDGTLDSSFLPTINNVVYAIAIQTDGKILVGGIFSNVNSTLRNRVARLYPDGTLDTGFNPNVNGDVLALALQADGKILLGGTLFAVSGIGRNYLARVNTDGSLDTLFNPSANSEVSALACLADGKLLVGGQFSSIASTARNRIARLNGDGTIDSAFNANVGNGHVRAIIPLPDGRATICGTFTSVASATRNRVARVNTDGTLDLSFDPNANNVVNCAALQCDGKVLIGGDFTTVAGMSRNRLARLNADGTPDTSFNPGVSNSVSGIGFQANGKVLIVGGFINVGGITRNLIARLDNDMATQGVNVSSPARIEWLRGGALQEAQSVSFDLSTDGGNAWAGMGNGTRIAGGWELTGLNLPASGQVRARARVTSGQYNGSSGLIESILPFTLALPEIAVELPVGTGLTDGSANIAFGTVVVGSSSGLFTFTIKNTGSADLTGLAVTKDGTHASDFIVNTTGMSTTVTPGGSTTFTVTFSPTAGGARSAAIHIASNDADENPFDINLTGTAIAPEIAVEQPVGNGLVDGAAFIDYGGVLPGTPVTRTFRIKNIGDATLTGVVATIDGTNSADFVRTVIPATSVAPGGFTTLTVRFTPSTTGDHAAMLHLVSNDGDENPFDINLTGEGLTGNQDWEQQFFGTTDGSGDAAPTADPNQNGISNLLEYALGGDPVGGGTGQEILPKLSINPTAHCAEFSLTRYLDRDDLILTVQATDSLPGPWTNLAWSVHGAPFTALAAGAVVTETGTGATRAVTVCDLYQTTDPAHPKRFMRLVVSNENFPTTGLVAHYRFNGNADDSVGTLHGTVNGATLTTNRLGQTGSAYAFNGTSNYIQIPDHDVLSATTSGSLSISVWVRPDGTSLDGSNNLLFSAKEGGGYVHWMGKGTPSHHEWAMRIYSADNTDVPSRVNRMSGYLFSLAGGTGAGSYFQDTLTAGQWGHCVMIIDTAAQTITWFKNGVQRDQDSFGPSSSFPVTPGNGTAPLRIGTRDFSSYFAGAVDDLRIFNRVLNAAEVIALYEED